MNDFVDGFKTGFRRSWRYGYFAPIMALYYSMTRPGSYITHLRALYRLCFRR